MLELGAITKIFLKTFLNIFCFPFALNILSKRVVLPYPGDPNIIYVDVPGFKKSCFYIWSPKG